MCRYYTSIVHTHTCRVSGGVRKDYGSLMCTVLINQDRLPHWHSSTFLLCVILLSKHSSHFKNILDSVWKLTSRLCSLYVTVHFGCIIFLLLKYFYSSTPCVQFSSTYPSLFLSVFTPSRVIVFFILSHKPLLQFSLLIRIFVIGKINYRDVIYISVKIHISPRRRGKTGIKPQPKTSPYSSPVPRRRTYRDWLI